jgi:hypothetical protein
MNRTRFQLVSMCNFSRAGRTAIARKPAQARRSCRKRRLPRTGDKSSQIASLRKKPLADSVPRKTQMKEPLARTPGYLGKIWENCFAGCHAISPSEKNPYKRWRKMAGTTRLELATKMAEPISDCSWSLGIRRWRWLKTCSVGRELQKEDSEAGSNHHLNLQSAKAFAFAAMA